MTSRERFEAYCVKWNFVPTGMRWNTWQAAERDMLERAIAFVRGQRNDIPATGEEFANALKELLNEQN